MEVLRATAQTRHPTEQTRAEQVLRDTLTERQTTLEALAYRLAQQRAEKAAQQQPAGHRSTLGAEADQHQILADHEQADSRIEDTRR